MQSAVQVAPPVVNAIPVQNLLEPRVVPAIPIKTSKNSNGLILLIIGIAFMVTTILPVILSIIIKPKRRNLLFTFTMDQEYTAAKGDDEFVRIDATNNSLLLLEEDEYVYAVKSIPQGDLPQTNDQVYIFIGFHEDRTKVDRFNYASGNYTRSNTFTSTINPKKNANGIILLDGALTASTDIATLGSNPFFYNSKNFPLTLDAFQRNETLSYKGISFLDRAAQFKAGVEYYAFMEIHPNSGLDENEIQVNLNGTRIQLDMEIRKRNDFKFL